MRAYIVVATSGEAFKIEIAIILIKLLSLQAQIRVNTLSIGATQGRSAIIIIGAILSSSSIKDSLRVSETLCEFTKFEIL